MHMKKYIYILLCGLVLTSCGQYKSLYSDYERPDTLGIPQELFRDTASADGVLAADTRRVAEQLNVPFTLITPFYPSEQHQICQNLSLINPFC